MKNLESVLIAVINEYSTNCLTVDGAKNDSYATRPVNSGFDQ